MPELALELPAADDWDPRRLTDWVELMMIIEARDSVSAADIRDRLQQVGEDGESEDEQEAEEVPFMQEVEDILREVERRASEAPGAYPFERDGDEMARTEGLEPALYLFLLLLSIEHVPFRKETYGNAVGPLFDYLSQAALQSLLGSGWRSVRFGWPVHARDQRPSGPRKALVWLADQLGLTHEKSSPLRKRGKDMGVDLVFWRPFADGEPGFMVVLAQCTVSSAEWGTTKVKDINRTSWLKYLGLGYEPITALVIPFAVPSKDGAEEWGVMLDDVSMIIDRCRLTELLCAVSLEDVTEHAAISTQLANWRAALEMG